MKCSSPARELVTFWLAGSLSPTEAALVEGHVASCAECRAAATDGADLMKGLRSLHLRADEVVAAAEGELHPPHLLVCAHCRDEVALLRDLGSDLVGSKRSGWAPSWRIGLASAATLLVSATAVWWVARPPEIGSTSESNDMTVRSGMAPVVQLLPVTPSPGGVPTFAWTPFDTAMRYRVDVFSEDGQLVWSRELEASSLPWPTDIPRAAGLYRWRVEALAGQATLARSRLGDVEIRP